MRFFSPQYALTLALFTTTVLFGQSDWRVVSSPVRDHLWGVCFGDGQFVAVGEHGTILTSPDGFAWTRRASGTDVWLTSVAHGFAQFLAVGAGGTLLRSRDGIAWEPAPNRTVNPTPVDRLNVVVFAGDSFVAYGENSRAVEYYWPARITSAGPGSSVPIAWWRGAAFGRDRFVIGGEAGLLVVRSGNRFLFDPEPIALPAGVRNVRGIHFGCDEFCAVAAGGAIVVSRDDLNWTRETTPTTADLQAIDAFNNTLIAVGDGGTVLVRAREGTWEKRAAPTSQVLLGVAGGETAAVIVGTEGTILRDSADATPPLITAAPASVNETLGGAAALVVRASGSAPLRYQWYRDGMALVGETAAELMRAPLAAADAGTYFVRVANSAGSADSPPASLALLPAPTPIVDSTFRADTSLDGMVRALLPLTDGSVLVATGAESRYDGVACRLRKLRSDGSLDSAWRESRFDVNDRNSIPVINCLVSDAGGRILVGGGFTTHEGAARPNLVRLNADGTLDDSFGPATEATARPITSIAVQPDGRILLANNSPVLLRLLASGARDDHFLPAPMPPAPPDPYGPGSNRDRLVARMALAADGRIYVAGVASLGGANVIGPLHDARLERWLPDGPRDPTFNPVNWSANLAGLRVVDDASVVLVQVVAEARTRITTVVEGRVVRILPDGVPFPNHASPRTQQLLASFIYPDGRVLYFGAGMQSPVRLTALGEVDPSFTGGIGAPSALVATRDRVIAGGSFDVYDGTPARRLARLNVVANSLPHAPQILRLTADRVTAKVDEAFTVRVAVTGSGPLTYDWTNVPGAPPNGVLRTNSAAVTGRFDSWPRARAIQVVVRNARGEAVSVPLSLAVEPAAPVILSQPTRVSAQTGRDILLTVGRNQTAGALDPEWRHNGVSFVPRDLSWLDTQALLPAVTAADAGTYTLTLRNALGQTVTTAPIVVTIDDTARFANLSTRAFVGAGAQTIIAGFIIPPGSARGVVIRGVGPSLGKFGITAPLADPQITLYRDGENVTNGLDDWDADDDHGAYQRGVYAKLGAFALDPGARDAALLMTLEPGNYTVQLAGKLGQSGIALIEIYENDNRADRLLNVSTRAFVRSDEPAIGGLVIQGPVPKRVLLRAAGPALTAFGVTGALADPRLEVKNAAGAPVAANDDWSTDPILSVRQDSFQAAGAFPLAPGSRDAALIATLPPGNYTMIVSGAPGESGIVLLEAYEIE